MKYPNLHKTLHYFDGKSGLSNEQVMYFLNKAFDNQTIDKFELKEEFDKAIIDENLNWIEFTNEITLLNNQNQFSSEEIKKEIVAIFKQKVFIEIRAKIKLRFLLDYTESPFWTIDEEAKSKFGYNVDLDSLGLHKNTIIRTKSITKLFQQRINPVYQIFPSFWSGRMNLFFQMFMKKVYSEIENELGDKYELINGEYDLMSQEINIEQIDRDLSQFLAKPSKYADEHGITYNSRQELEKEIQMAYQDWEKIEFKWTTI